jgi:hypothetical protein
VCLYTSLKVHNKSIQRALQESLSHMPAALVAPTPGMTQLPLLALVFSKLTFAGVLCGILGLN